MHEIVHVHPVTARQADLFICKPQLGAVPEQVAGPPGDQAQPSFDRQVARVALALHALRTPAQMAEVDQEHPYTAEHEFPLVRPAQPWGDGRHFPGPGSHQQWAAVAQVWLVVFALHRVGVPVQGCLESTE